MTKESEQLRQKFLLLLIFWLLTHRNCLKIAINVEAFLTHILEDFEWLLDEFGFFFLSHVFPHCWYFFDFLNLKFGKQNVCISIIFITKKQLVLEMGDYPVGDMKYACSFKPFLKFFKILLVHVLIQIDFIIEEIALRSVPKWLYNTQWIP